jgi:hypothetical protein
MRESYCGLCDNCQLGNPDFLEAVSRVKEFVGTRRANYWNHCFPHEEGFNFVEFRKGLDWFLVHRDCPGCKEGRGNEDCPIRICAQEKHLDHCSRCSDLEQCNKFDFLLAEFPEVKTNLIRQHLRLKAWEYHKRLEGERK